VTQRMKIASRWRAMTPAGRRTVVAALVLVAGGGIAWAAVAARARSTDRAPVTARGAMPGMRDTSGTGMAGMEGMNMGGDGSVRLTPQQLRQFGVTFGNAEMRMLTSEMRATGAVTVDETRVVQVTPRFGGFAERLYVNFTGQAVRRGAPLLEIYSPELVAAQQELLLARRLERTLDESAVPGAPGGRSGMLAAARQRLALWDISDAQIEGVLRTGRVRRTMTLHSPASGVVTAKHLVQGQAVAAGMPLYTIADLSQVWIDVELREPDAAAVQLGSGADVELAALPGRTLRGRVSFIHPLMDVATRTVRARVTVTNTDMMLKPGMYATVRLSSPSRRALTVPTTAVIRTGLRNVVFVDMGTDGLMPHEVEVGRVTAELTEILAGIEPGQRVVTSAQYLLESESNLGEVMKAMMGQMGAGAGMQDMPGMVMP
jgi:membrane fusion protein, copper/silver efflux system